MRPPPSADGLPPWFARGAPDLLARLARDGGFTVDPRTGETPRAGFAHRFAPRPRRPSPTGAGGRR